MRKHLVSTVVVLMIVIGSGTRDSGTSLSAQPRVSIKLFDAIHAFGTGPVTSFGAAIPFATQSLILTFAPGDSAVLSSTPDGTGPLVIDNFIIVNGVNACGTAESSHESCFGPVLNPDVPLGAPIDTILTPVPPIDVSALIPVGTTSVVFELRDFGSIAGNTSVFLVTTATPRLTQSLAIDSDGSHLVIADVAADGRRLAWTYTKQDEKGAAKGNFSSTITLADRTMVQMEGTLPNALLTHPSTVQINLTRDLVGADNVTFVSNGNMIRGRIGERRIVPVPVAVGVEPLPLQFAGGGPPPRLNISRQDLSSLMDFADRLRRLGPVAVAQQGGESCSDRCVARACNELEQEHVPVVRTNDPFTGGPVCQFNENELDHYKDHFNRCWEENCDIYRLIFVDAPFTLWDLARYILRVVSLPDVH